MLGQKANGAIAGSPFHAREHAEQSTQHAYQIKDEVHILPALESPNMCERPSPLRRCFRSRVSLTVIMLRTNSPKRVTAATRAMFRAMR